MHFVNYFLIAILVIVIPAAALAEPPTKPLEQMEVAFIDNPSKADIKKLLDTAMKLYKLPINEENYSRAGSVLVVMRKQNGVSEMSILRYMIKSHVQGMDISFPDAAAISVTFLKAGDR